eukprot:6479248-Amphidinium_carterae.1
MEEMPPWWDTLLRYGTSGGITREMISNWKTWENMETSVKEPGYIAISLPMLYEPSPMKGRHVAHDVRKEAILEVIDDIGIDAFKASVDYQIKSGETIEWDDPEREGVETPVTAEVGVEARLNFFARLKLPTEIERDVARRSAEIAARRQGKRIMAK